MLQRMFIENRFFSSLGTIGRLFLFLSLFFILLLTSLSIYSTTKKHRQLPIQEPFTDTILKLYRPFGEVVDQATPMIKAKVSGKCEGQSHLIIREDAWRCMAKGKIYDPCFVNGSGNQQEAICPQSPWQGDSVLITVNSPLNNQRHTTLDMSRAFPWAIELVNGERCQAVDTHELYDSMPIRYRCHQSNILFGYLQRCKTIWSMLKKSSRGVETVEFKRAWF